MKRTLFIVMLSFVTAVSMAQPPHHDHHGHGPGHHDKHAPHPEVRYVERSTPEQLAMVLRVIDGQSFDDKKLEVAELSVTLGHFCVHDMVQMASRFSFDDKRKEFFIYAYTYCVDRENYFLIKDAMSFRSNFDDVMETVMPGYRR